MYNQDTQESNTKKDRFGIAGIPLSAIAVLLLTTFGSLLWSHHRLLFRDEFYEMWTDSVSSIGQVIHIQLTNPVALDPLAHHVLAHACIKIFGANTFAIRLPALIGVLLMQICLFVFVRRLATERAAVFAMGFPALTCVLSYSAEGRPYGLLLGTFGLAMVCWQTAVHRKTKRTLALIGLAATLAVALNVQYFGVLLFAPLCVAEVFRIFQRKRLDLPMMASFAVGSAGILLVLPFMAVAKEFRNVYPAGMLSPKIVISSYKWTLIAGHTGSNVDRLVFVIVSLVIGFSLWAYERELRKRAFLSWEPDQILLIALAALPVFGFALALFTSPSLEPRYMISLIIGISALTALGLFSFSQSDHSEKLILKVLFVAIAFTSAFHIWSERIASRETMATMRLKPELKAAIMANPSQKLYVENMECFGNLTFNEPDTEVRSHVSLLYSRNQETKWNEDSVITLTALHLHNFAHISITPYEVLASQPGEHVVVDFVEPSIRLRKPRGWNWMGLALAADHANVRFLGSAFSGSFAGAGDVLSVNFAPQRKLH